MKRTEKVLRYSIRKSVLGVSSVLICALFLGHSMVAADEERPVANAVETPVAASPVNQDLITVKEAANTEVGTFLAEKGILSLSMPITSVHLILPLKTQQVLAKR